MPHHPAIALRGRVTDVFAHRFVIETDAGERHLADLGPKGAESLRLKAGDQVALEGEKHPSEIKVTRLTRGGDVVDVHRPPKPGGGDNHADANPTVAIDAVEAAGAATLGEPVRHPKHFEVLGQKGSTYFEYHVAFDGHIRKEKPLDPDDRKWASVIGR